MATHRITDNSFFVGVLDPNRRKYDLTVDTPYGTTFNSYLISSGKTALIDSVPEEFWDEYRYNVGCLCDFSDIDYIIINDPSPARAGCLKHILEFGVKATVVCTETAQQMLVNQVGGDFNCMIVKDGETLSLGRHTLRFITSDKLIFPESMMTLLDEERALFSGTMFGAHFCQPTMFDEHIPSYQRSTFMAQTAEYYYSMLSPFAEDVRRVLAKLSTLGVEPDAVCPFNGPIMVKDHKLVMRAYKDICTEKKEKRTAKQICVLYASCSGYTKRMAEAAARRLKSLGCDVICTDIATADAMALRVSIEDCDGLLIGTPTINGDAPAPVWNILTGLDAFAMEGKKAGVFGSYGWSGEGAKNIEARLKGLKCDIVKKYVAVRLSPDKKALDAVRAMASKLIEDDE